MRVTPRIEPQDSAAWQALCAATPGATPFNDLRFLQALQESGCVGPGTGWHPLYLWIEQDGAVVACCAHYAKTHSWGEYVFDHAWAQAFARHGLDYYPKGLVAIPFTPAPGPRLLARDPEARAGLATGLCQLAAGQGWSSVHILFPDERDRAALDGGNWLVRDGVQWQWRNNGFASFDSFLATLRQPKRKKILAERRKVQAAGVVVEPIAGRDATPDDIAFFYRCHVATYHAHGHEPYLNQDFFERLFRFMPEHLVLFMARRAVDDRIACSLLVHDDHTLWGRHWGAIEHVPCLHFETCYYAPIEWAIAQGLHCFEGGAQGEHKMARGFLPHATHSAHWIAQPEFRDAIARFVRQESGALLGYLDELQERSPIRTPSGVTADAPDTGAVLP